MFCIYFTIFQCDILKKQREIVTEYNVLLVIEAGDSFLMQIFVEDCVYCSYVGIPVNYCALAI